MPQRAAAIRVRLTRLGWQFAFVGVFAMLGGAIRAYNLPLLLAGLLTGTLVLQWRWSRLTLQVVRVQRRLPREAFAGQPFPVRFLLTNVSRRLPAWLLRVDDMVHLRGEHRRWAGQWRGAASSALKASCGLGVLPTGRTLSAQYECLLVRRGRYEFGPASLSTGFPLGLTLAQRSDRAQETLYVFPRRLPLVRHWQRELHSRVGGSTTTAPRSGYQEGEFFGIRSWQAGDSRRWIHWRTSARIGEPAVRQYEQQRRFELCIVVDAFREAAAAPRGHGDPATEAADEALESVISAAATLVTELVATPTNKLGLAIAGERAIALTSGGGREHTVAMLQHLTELAGSPQPDVVGAVRQMIRTSGRPRDLVILSPRPVLENLQELVDLIGKRSSLQWRSVADGSLQRIVECSPTAAAAVESKASPPIASGRGEHLDGSNHAARNHNRT